MLVFPMSNVSLLLIGLRLATSEYLSQGETSMVVNIIITAKLIE